MPDVEAENNNLKRKLMEVLSMKNKDDRVINYEHTVNGRTDKNSEVFHLWISLFRAPMTFAFCHFCHFIMILWEKLQTTVFQNQRGEL